uniref:Alpha/beta hydrolase n=1 Tax=Roseihalotalea indica TaxID=2867963 RepID=A0AA49JFY6_9BACT|nr:alpha/beta hydrolase [Tunicatimonas sp. TK19036]
MKTTTISLLLSFAITHGFSQTNPVMDAFPEGTVLHGNIPYNDDTLQKHLLDIYLPPNAQGKLPLVIFVHGGGWLSNDKYADIGYMKKTVAEIVSSGFALASIDYRFSTQAVFPAQIQDCNRAVSFLYDNADTYGFDPQRFAVMGFSAGGHLASLMGLSNNDQVNAFFMTGTSQSFTFKAVVDFYGPAELILFPGADDAKSPEGLLIGAAPLARPDLAKAASPVTYVDQDDPPFLIIHGEKDALVSPRHSQLLSAWLDAVDVSNELIIVKDAPHFGEMFDVDAVRNKVVSFLKDTLK